MLVTLTACSPLDMLAFLGGCKNTGGSSTVQASQASGEWTGLGGQAPGSDQADVAWAGEFLRTIRLWVPMHLVGVHAAEVIGT